jgi:4,5-DOPA dioxygenase extradiol
MLKDCSDVKVAKSARGLDHIPLKYMYPKGGVPVIQVSTPNTTRLDLLSELGSALRKLQDEEGVMLLGSGGLVHNLHHTFKVVGKLDLSKETFPPVEAPEPWASEFQSAVFKLMETGVSSASKVMKEIKKLKTLNLGHPTKEHLFPLLVMAGASKEGKGFAVHDSWSYGSLSMAAIQF